MSSFRKTFNSAMSTVIFSKMVMLACVSSAATPLITEYPLPSAGSGPYDITVGADGYLWFTENNYPHIGRMSPHDGSVTEFNVAGSGEAAIVALSGITLGPNGNVWFTDSNDYVGFITPSGTAQTFQIASPEIASSGGTLGITKGSDGNIWYTLTKSNQIGMTTPQGVSTAFSGLSSQPRFITSGPDGNLWFTEYGTQCGTDFCTATNAMIGRMTPSGTLTEFAVTNSNSFLSEIVTGPDNALWFTESQGGSLDAAPAGGDIGRITTDGVVTEFPVPTSGSVPAGITKGPDGNLWFTESAGNNIGRITTTGQVTEYAIPTASSNPLGITTGSDGNIWFIENFANQIGKLTPSLAISAGFTGNWFDASQSGHGFSIEILPGNIMLAEWYVFAPTGGQAWIAATGPINGNTAVLQAFYPAGSGALFPPNYNAAAVADQPWGTITVTFSDCSSGQVSWQSIVPGYGSGSIPITRLTLPAGLTCP